jgi:hypothetical protein
MGLFRDFLFKRKVLKFVNKNEIEIPENWLNMLDNKLLYNSFFRCLFGCVDKMVKNERKGSQLLGDVSDAIGAYVDSCVSCDNYETAFEFIELYFNDWYIGR